MGSIQKTFYHADWLEGSFNCLYADFVPPIPDIHKSWDFKINRFTSLLFAFRLTLGPLLCRLHCFNVRIFLLKSWGKEVFLILKSKLRFAQVHWVSRTVVLKYCKYWARHIGYKELEESFVFKIKKMRRFQFQKLPFSVLTHFHQELDWLATVGLSLGQQCEVDRTW